MSECFLFSSSVIMHSDNVWTWLHAASRCFPIIATTSLKALTIQRELVLMLWFDKLLGWNFYSIVAERREHEFHSCSKKNWGEETFLGGPGICFRTLALELDCWVYYSSVVQRLTQWYPPAVHRVNSGHFWGCSIELQKKVLYIA